MVNVTKLYPSEDANVFYAFGRVLSGTCKFIVFYVRVFCSEYTQFMLSFRGGSNLNNFRMYNVVLAAFQLQPDLQIWK